MIRLENVSKSFGNREILHNINLTINSGEVTFIVGSSGAGKTTLLNLIGGLDYVSGGKIFLDGEDITESLDEYRAQKVGYVFQDFNLISGLSVKQNVELGLLYANKHEGDIVSQLEELGIKEMHQTVETMSGGEKQRVAIVRSICKDSEIIIADEPTGNLDTKNAKTVFEMLVNMKQNKHIVIVSHDIEMANRYGDRIITLSDGKIINDRIMHIKSEPERLAKNKVLSNVRKKSIAPIFMVGLNSIKLRKSKIISMALVIALAISMLAMVFDFNKLGNTVTKNVNVNYLENDLISVFYSSTANLGYKETPFTNDELSYITEKYGVDEITSIFMEREKWLLSNNSKNYETSIKQINLNDFFEERIMSYDIEGRFPEESNEIILAEDAAKELFDGDCIGKEVAINDGFGEMVTCKIVGINKTINPLDEIYSIVSSEKIKELYEKIMTKNLYARMEIQEYKEEKASGGSSVSTGGAYASMAELTGNEICVLGSLAKNKNEIMVSTAVLPYVFESFGISGDNEEDRMEELSHIKVALKHNGVHEVYISGVYESDELEMRVSEDLVKDLKDIKPTALEIYAPTRVDVSDMKIRINDEEKFTCYLQLENLKNSISKQTGYFKLALVVVGIIMILVSIAMLASFSKIVVLERRQEIAILKSLGATDKNIVLTLWFDSVTISLLAYILALILTKICVEILPRFMQDMSFVEFNYPILSLSVLGICFLLFVCIYTYVSMQKLVRKMPAELFKH